MKYKKIKYIFCYDYTEFLECCKVNGWDKRSVVYVTKLEDLIGVSEDQILEYRRYYKNPVWHDWASSIRKLKETLKTKLI